MLFDSDWVKFEGPVKALRMTSEQGRSSALIVNELQQVYSGSFFDLFLVAISSDNGLVRCPLKREDSGRATLFKLGEVTDFRLYLRCKK